MKFTVVKLITIVIVLALFSCNNYESEVFNREMVQNQMQFDYNQESLGIIKNYDKRMDRFAKCIAKVLDDAEVCELIKNRALEQWDGDTEFLYKDVIDCVLTNGGKLNSKLASKMIVENYGQFRKELKEYYIEDSKKRKVDELNNEDLKEEYLNRLSFEFPSLQIAVRGDVKGWKVATIKPVVIYIPSNFDEDWEVMDAYDSQGKKVQLVLTLSSL